jgi:TRAP-type C4-dicarboxylate transport system substrate-binding protein
MTRSTRRGLTLMGVVMAACLAAAPPSAAQPRDFEVKYADLGPPRGPRAQSLMWWGHEIESRTGGRVKVKFFWSESLARAHETLRLVGAGVADAGTVLGIYNPVDLPIWNLANAPSGDSDPWVGMRTWHEMRQAVQELQREATEQNIRILMNFTSGPVDILSKTPILLEGDLRGKRIRATGGWTPLFKSLGATTVNLTFPETYEGFSGGRIDGAIGYIPFLKAYKLYEVVGHVTEARLGQVLGYGAGINLTVWNGMPEDVRGIISDVSDAFIDRYARAYLEDVEETKRELTAGIGGRTVQFQPLTPEERARWVAKSTFVNDWARRMSAQGVDARRIVDALGRIRAKYEAELAGKGYPWARK